MKSCPMCGTLLFDDAEKCTKCGRALSEEGEAHGRLIGDLMSMVSPSKVYASSLNRLHHTITIAACRAGYTGEIQSGERLWEVGFGVFTGKTIQEIREMCGDPTLKEYDDKYMNDSDFRRRLVREFHIETLERVAGYHRKEILVISLASFILGTMSFMNNLLLNPLLVIYLVLIVVLVIFYCFFKSLVIINHIILGISHIFLPYFMIKINAGDILLNIFPNLDLFEWLILLSITSVAFTGQMLHEMIDGDSLSKLKPRTSQLVIWIASIISLIIAIVSFIITQYLIFLPVVFFPFGIMYIFRKPRNDLLGRTSLKDTGIILGNLMFTYVIILIIAS